MSAIGKIGVRSGGPAGCIVPGCSGGSGSPGKSGRRFTQWVGIRSSVRRNFVGVSLIVLMVRRPYRRRRDRERRRARRRTGCSAARRVGGREGAPRGQPVEDAGGVERRLVERARAGGDGLGDALAG